jgi:hypothetical protein
MWMQNLMTLITTLMNWEFDQVSILEFKGQEVFSKILDNNIKVLKSTRV